MRKIGLAMMDASSKKREASYAKQRLTASYIVQCWRAYRRRQSERHALSDKPTNRSEEKMKLLKFEEYFFQIDVDGSGTLTMDELRTFFSYAAMDQPIGRRREALRQVGRQLINRRNKGNEPIVDGFGRTGNTVTRVDFVRTCAAMLWNVPDNELQAACAAYRAAVVSARTGSQVYWEDMAQSIDERSRLIIPGIFAAAIIWLLCASQLPSDTHTMRCTRTLPLAPPIPCSYYRTLKLCALFVIRCMRPLE